MIWADRRLPNVQVYRAKRTAHDELGAPRALIVVYPPSGWYGVETVPAAVGGAGSLYPVRAARMDPDMLHLRYTPASFRTLSADERHALLPWVFPSTGIRRLRAQAMRDARRWYRLTLDPQDRTPGEQVQAVNRLVRERFPAAEMPPKLPGWRAGVWA